MKNNIKLPELDPTVTKFEKCAPREGKTEDILPSCYANYCKDHEACQNCPYKEDCKSVVNPKEPGWCQ